MLDLSKLRPKKSKKSRRRAGRGAGSGRGAYSGRGIKGQKARAGGNIRPGFEGGRTPLIRQLPKIGGFKSHHPDNQPVNLSDLEKTFETGAVVTPKTLQKAGLVERAGRPVKILGKGKLTKKLTFHGLDFSQSAKSAVEKAGGVIQE